MSASNHSVTNSLSAGWISFWFEPRSPLPLHAIRVIFGILLLVWLIPFSGYLHEFFGFEGWFDRAAFIEAGNLMDNQSWSLLYLVAHDASLLSTFYWASLVVIILYTLGFFTRITSVLTWLIVASFTANPLIEIDTDVFFRLISFYLMIGYLFIHLGENEDYSLTNLLTPMNYWIGRMFKQNDARSSAATTALRLLQVHFALAIVIMGLHKLQMAEWWAGVSYWYPMHRPSETSIEAINEVRTYNVRYLFWISICAYFVMAWQIFFPTFAWKTGWPRCIMISGAILGAIGLTVIYPIPLLGVTFLLLCASFLTDFEWQWLLSPILRLVKS